MYSCYHLVQAGVTAFFRSVVVMTPNLKPIGELGSVAQGRCGRWRACARLCGETVYGPSRSQASAAQADLQVARTASTRADMAAVLNRLKIEAANESASHAAVAEEQAEEIRKLKKANEALMQDNQNLRRDNQNLKTDNERLGIVMQDNQNLKRENENLTLKMKKMKTENQSLREHLVEEDFKHGSISVSPSFRKDVIAATPDARAPFVASTQSSAVCKPLLNQREASSASSADGASTDVNTNINISIR